MPVMLSSWCTPFPHIPVNTVLNIYKSSFPFQVLIFSQMTKMLDILEDYCIVREHKYCRLDGSYSVQDRQEQVSDP